MAGKGGSGKTSGRKKSSSGATSSRTSSRNSSRTSGGKTRRTQQRSAPVISLRPEHQRELFALGLIAVALVTIIFFVTGTTGSIGSLYVAGMQEVFGRGALIVPLALGILGGAILIQERMRDTQLTGSNILGIIIILTTILTLIEFPQHHLALDAPDRNSTGGGWVGFNLVNLLDTTIGRPAALAIVIILMLAGILLTFNITLHELVTGMSAWLRSLWAMLWSGPRRAADEDEQGQQQLILAPRKKVTKGKAGKEDVGLIETTTLQPASDTDMVLTPIAERPTRASLYRRSESESGSSSESSSSAKQPAPTASNGEGQKSPPEPPANPADPTNHPPLPAPADSSAQQAQPDGTQKVQERLENFDVPAIHLAWPLPSLNLLDKATVSGTTEEEEAMLIRLARRIEETLASFKVEAQVINTHTGPVITQFELQPAVGVKISKITTLEKDLALALAASSIRIEAPIPGKSVVGIEIPNPSISLVTLREVIDSPQFENHKGKLKLPLGKDVSGTPVIADMTRMPHLLVAGSTGSGKSVAINSFLCGLLLKHTPDELRVILIDPKMVELIVYNHVPHLLSPVVTELERVVPTLKWATREMERRYKIFARHGCRNLESYIQRSKTRADLEPMPYILLVIDELADLMMMAPDDIETQVCRLAQMARATGIHLIIATQRPSVDVITGLIKANFPSRISFAVTSQVDSRVILDTPGADRLLGRGDMLYMAADSSKLMRMQGTYVSDKEVEKIVSFWREAAPPQKVQGEKRTSSSGAGSSAGSTSTQATGTGSQQHASSHAHGQGQGQDSGQDQDTGFKPPAEFLSTDEQEALLPQAIDLVKKHKRASASLLQRRMRIGYSKAAQLIELLEQHGIVGSAEEGRSREVLHNDTNSS